jgi:selenocysteine lyase/cysteine desulfurase
MSKNRLKVMKEIFYTKYGSHEVLQLNEAGKPATMDNEKVEAFAELERGVYSALETYSNVHRGSGHNSMVTTHLFEQARAIVL